MQGSVSEGLGYVGFHRDVDEVCLEAVFRSLTSLKAFGGRVKVCSRSPQLRGGKLLGAAGSSVC